MNKTKYLKTKYNKKNKLMIFIKKHKNLLLLLM